MRDPTPPTAIDALHRLHILQKITGLAYLGTAWTVMQKTLADRPSEEQTAFHNKHAEIAAALAAPLHKPPLAAAVSPIEKRYLSHTPDAWPTHDLLDASWRIEAAQTLAWSLGLLSALPPYDTRAPRELFKSLKSAAAPAPLDDALLRPIPELQRASDLAELWHWRSRTRQLVERNEPFNATDKMREKGIHTFNDILRLAAEKAAARNDIPTPIDNDFPAKGKPYRDLTPAEWAEVRSITMERHRTLNWLCGKSPNNAWDETPTPT